MAPHVPVQAVVDGVGGRVRGGLDAAGKEDGVHGHGAFNDAQVTPVDTIRADVPWENLDQAVARTAVRSSDAGAVPSALSGGGSPGSVS